MKRLLVFIPCLLLAACKQVPKSADQPIAPYQRELLTIAFEGVSKMPLNPHIKNRSRGQYEVIETALSLGHAEWAEEQMEQMANWQRWMGYGALAKYYAGRGDVKSARAALSKVNAALKTVEEAMGGQVVALAENPLLDTLSDWRYQQVKTLVQEVEALLAPLPEVEYETAMADLRILAASEDFEVIYAAQLGMVKQAERRYSELNVQEWMAQELDPGFAKMPLFLRIDVLVKLGEVALEHDAPDQAIALADRAETMLEEATLPPRLYIPEAATLIALRAKAEDRSTAQERLDALVNLYDDNRAVMVDIERAALLCRIAEAQQALGYTARAEALYQRAADEAQVNPNARPQADDLSIICRSMALAGVEPSAALLTELQNIKNGLSEPW